jgi:hypothetical protein
MNFWKFRHLKIVKFLWKIRAFVTVHTCVPVTGIFQKAAKESGVVKPEYGG